MSKMIWDFTKSVFHNCLIHPLICFLPRRWARVIHEANAKWAYGEEGPFNGLD